ncbi:hypothetical protein CQA38_02660 [Campylobacter sp. MIT 12-5580]|uniref:hypothetical protein n=1 Tax=Campylobacter sp. MIT 12-5580 TaxID=2040651 RepID=UPI0010F573DE|nr:hypothetical protein [Campylobacter sp. MIT 12-5580]TKX29690.1 hypothetical protein CQA38_02660 [Campylobacter sp. MIT 12-5580]
MQITHSTQTPLKDKGLGDLIKEKIDEKKLVKLDKEQNSGVRVIFEDAKSGKLVSTSLSDENFARLRENINDYANFYTRDDGSVRLNGRAERFVSSWYEKVSSGQSLQASSLSSTVSFSNSNANALEKLASLRSYESTISADANENEKLNYALSKDKNLDGEIKQGEKDAKEQRISFIKELKEAGENFFKKLVGATEIASSKSKNSKDKDEEENLKQKALEEGLSSLSTLEQTRLKQEYPSEYKELENLSKLEENLSKDFYQRLENDELKILELRA